ncbi:alpha/beta hydrolase family protein [Stenotrophomonas sp. LGBM10]|uniref:alpha/beta hydrolase family protein n=1 Tax=Stenotrophomonas sp. LGBM10 TaxID=3390038 RepID=UPI00398ADE9F
MTTPESMLSRDPLALSTASRPDQRMAHRFRFDDPDMDLFFMSATSWGPTGGLDIGQINHVATQIVDGDADSWVDAFAGYAALQRQQADTWAARGWQREAGEARLKAFASFRSAWQFADAGGARFSALYAQQRATFAQAMQELGLPATFFQVPFDGHALPGVFLRHADATAPVVLVVGGADTSLEDLFLSVGRALLERGFSVALVDLPGQGNTAADGLYWSTEPEHAIAAVVDALIERFHARAGRIALIGLSLGGYFVARAAQFDARFATVIASTPFPHPGELFERSARADQARVAQGQQPTSSALRSRRMMAWKAGVGSAEQLLARWRDAHADPRQVTVPFLSIVGGGDSPIFVNQALQWHAQLASPHTSLVVLDASTGADGHCQVAARLRLVQEACGWMRGIFHADIVPES